MKTRFAAGIFALAFLSLGCKNHQAYNVQSFAGLPDNGEICPIDEILIDAHETALIPENGDSEALGRLADELLLRGHSCESAKQLAQLNPPPVRQGSEIDSNPEFSLNVENKLKIVHMLIRKVGDGWNLVFRASNGTTIERQFKNDVPGLIKKMMDAGNTSLLKANPKIWTDLIEHIRARGMPNQSLRTTLVPVLLRLDEATKAAVFNGIKKNYSAAYHNKHKLPIGNGFAPKRAYDLILRYALPPDRFFSGSMSGSEAIAAWRKFFKTQKGLALEGTDFGSYTPDDVIGVAKEIRRFIISKGAQAQDVEVLMKGSFPSGRANLKRRNPLESPADSILQGASSSYSDVDMLVTERFMPILKQIQDGIYSKLVSPEARKIVDSSGAKPFFQMHPHPDDVFAELDGSMMSPIGLRISQGGITLVVYKPKSALELPSREAIAKMTPAQKDALLKSWTLNYKIE
jgi:hypothetical protein